MRGLGLQTSLQNRGSGETELDEAVSVVQELPKGIRLRVCLCRHPNSHLTAREENAHVSKCRINSPKERSLLIPSS